MVPPPSSQLAVVVALVEDERLQVMADRRLDHCQSGVRQGAPKVSCRHVLDGLAAKLPRPLESFDRGRRREVQRWILTRCGPGTMGGKEIGEVGREILAAEEVQQIAVGEKKVPEDPRRVVLAG